MTKISIDNEKNDKIPKQVKHFIIWGIVAVLLLIVIFGSFYIVNVGHRGVVITLGKADPVPSSEGIHLKYPIIQRVVYMNVQTQKYEAKASSASSDLQIVATDIAVNYHISPESTSQLYKEIGVDYNNKIIQPAVQEVVKASTAQYTAEELITKRGLVKDKIDTALGERLAKRGIIMETTSITNFDFSPEFNNAIEQKVTAEQNALTAKNRLSQVEYEAKQAIAQANGTATALILNAKAQAEQKLLIAQSEAKALELQKAQVTDDLIKLRIAEKWNGQLPLYMMGSTIPLVQMPELMNNATAR